MHKLRINKCVLSRSQTPLTTGSADPDKLPAKRQKKAPRKDYDDMVVSSEYVLVKPVSKRAMKLGQKKEWRPVQLCSVDKAPEVKLSAERLAMTSWKGYRMASAVLLSVMSILLTSFCGVRRMPTFLQNLMDMSSLTQTQTVKNERCRRRGQRTGPRRGPGTLK